MNEGALAAAEGAIATVVVLGATLADATDPELGLTALATEGAAPGAAAGPAAAPKIATEDTIINAAAAITPTVVHVNRRMARDTF